VARTFAALDHSASIPEIVSTLFEDTTRCGATDIHFDPITGGIKVRARIDGVLHEIGTLPDDVARHVRSRIKVLAGMDLVEKREPQDGHIYLQTEHGHRDFRVATILTGLGERMVVRVHQAVEQGQSLDALGLEDDQAATVRRLLARPQGLILVAGPIGSGKTTTLYACLRATTVPERCLITIEDPIEYHLDGVTQVEVRPNLGLSFARGLRAVLRQDPNVIMVGEIRDRDTARTASRAAAAGALVLSSIHAADGYGVLRSLTNYHVPPHRIGESVAGIIVQRLVRTLCMSCKRPVSADSTPAGVLADKGLVGGGANRLTLFDATGCSHCFGTGFRGRTGVFEVIEFGEPGWDRSGTGRSKSRWSHALLAGRTCDLLGAAARKVVRGITTIDEVRRVFPSRHDVPGSPLVG
jgi:type II secretory ATPase GspE/PulE/Tfp pilus assembly ATPase PilB-like protein